MRRLLILLLLSAIFLPACKKDLLYFQSVRQLNSYTDSDRLNKIFFLTDSIGFIVGGERYQESLILTTRDGGYTWQKTTVPEADKALFDITLSPGGALYAIGFDGKLLRSYDTGNTWIFSQLDFFPFTGIAFTDPAHCIAVGGISFSSGERHYIDSNGTLIRHDSEAYQFNKVNISGQTGYLCGYGLVEKSNDGGQTWYFQNVQGDNFECMDIHGEEIWMCGYAGSIYYTSDGGNNWVRYRNGNDITLPAYHLYSIVFRDDNNGWAVGEAGIMLYSKDGGRHWSQYQQFTGATLYSVALCANGDLLVAGDAGALYRVTPN